MRTSRSLPISCIALLILVLLANTLAPLLLQAGTAAGAGARVLVELCTTSGTMMTFVMGDDATQADPQDHTGTQHQQHCALCGVRVDPVAPTLHVPAVRLVAVGLAYLPPLFNHAPRALFVWAASQARAPPYSA